MTSLAPDHPAAPLLKPSLRVAVPLAALLVAAFTLPTAAAAHQSAAPKWRAAEKKDCKTGYRSVKGQGTSCRVGNDLYKVKIPGHGVVLTHGPDPRTVEGDRPSALGFTGQMSADAVSRKPACATRQAYRTILAVPADGSFTDSQESVRTSIEAANGAFYHGAVESGSPGGAHYRFVCDGNGDVDIDVVRLPTASADTNFATIERDLQGLGYNDPGLKYAVHYDAESPQLKYACGQATIYPDDRAGAENQNNEYSDMAMNYDCDAETWVHEIGHNLGAVQRSAPHATGAGHCWESRDIMCYNDGGDLDRPITSNCDDFDHFDCGHDDYFDAKIGEGQGEESGSYLDTHWNVGGCYNAWIENAACRSSGPAHDDFSAAQSLTGTTDSRTGDTNSGATKEPGEPDHARDSGGASIWYRWTAPVNGPVTIDTSGSDFDTTLAAYSGSALDELSESASNDDAREGEVSSQVTFQASAGRTYRIAVDGYSGAEGNVTLALKQVEEKKPGALALYLGGSRYRRVDDTLRLYGTISPRKPSVSIVVYLKGSDGVYRRRSSLAADASTGRYSRNYRLSRRGVYRLRAYFAGDATHSATWSSSIYVHSR